MNARVCLSRFCLLLSGASVVSLAVFLTVITTRTAGAGCVCGIIGPHHHSANQPYVPGPGNVVNLDTGGQWYWMRSPEQERRVVMSLYNRYCIRCHGVDGRGIWDIPCVPDFTNVAWQASRADPYRTRVILEGRGAVMPAFRGTLTLEEACAMARYLHTFVPGSEVSRPDLGAAATRNQPTGTSPAGIPAVTSTPAPPSPTTPSPFTPSRQPVR
jgi:mono/diheme cytochrome c family protein